MIFLSSGESFSFTWIFWSGFFFVMEKMLWPFTAMVICGGSRPIYYLQSWPVYPFFLGCPTLLIWPLIISPLSLWCFFFFFLEPKDGLVFESRASLITYCGFYSNCFQIHYAVRAVITILFLQFGCKQPQIKAESITLVIF